MLSNVISFLRDYLFTMPVLARFAVLMVLLVTIPRLSRRLHVPVPVGLLLSGVVVGPYVLTSLARSDRSQISWRNWANCC